MSALAIVLIVVGVLLLLLFVGGYIANTRRREAERAALHARARQADQHLASAHAQDKGWERATLEQAARAAYTERKGAPPAQLMLVQVVDRPGIEEDEAVFQADGERMVLGRTSDGWRSLT